MCLRKGSSKEIPTKKEEKLSLICVMRMEYKKYSWGLLLSLWVPVITIALVETLGGWRGGTLKEEKWG